MVTNRFWLLLLGILLFPMLLRSDDDVQIHAELYPYNIVENKALPGTIEVTHDQSIIIDPANFSMKGQPLKVSLTKNVKIASDNPLMVSIYSFELPPQPAGLEVLPEISLKVGDKIYKSFSSTYEVLPSSSTTPESPSNTPVEPNIPSIQTESHISGTLQIKAAVEGTEPLYPGQRLKFVYYYYYKGNIGLTKEQLPLLDAKGFLKIGDKEIKDYTVGENSVREITQVVEAVKPGHFSFGPSIVEGLAYQDNASGKTEYGNTTLKSEVPDMSVNVEPFPSAGKPASFNGAVGEFNFDVSLLNSPTITVGDKINLSIKISGKTSDWTGLPLPELCCQPGFSGLFSLSDIPPKEEIKQDSKTFIVEFRPLSDQIKEMPSIEFSYFDPTKRKYVVLHSQPIPLTVKPHPKSAADALLKEPTPVKKVDETLPESAIAPQQPPPIEILGNYPLNPSDLHNLFLGTWWNLWLIPFGAVLIYLQINLRREIFEKERIKKVENSQSLFNEAMIEPASATFFHKLTQAFLLRLVERGEIDSTEISSEDLPNTGMAGEVRAFLCSIEEKRFTGKKSEGETQIMEEAQKLFEKLNVEMKI